MKAFICTALLALVAADQTHHQSIKQGNAPAVTHSVHKPHGAVHASVVSQPHAAPQSVHGYGSYEKPAAAAIAPAALPIQKGYAPAPVYHAAPAPAYHAPVVHAAPAYHAPVVHAAPAYHAPAPAYHAPAPAYHAPAPAYHAPAPAYHAPVVKAPVVAAPAYHAPVVKAPVVAAPAYHAPVVKVAPVVHAAPAYHAPAPAYKPAPYVEEKGAPEPYTYEYAVADDYSKANFNAGETSDANGVVSGSYSVALPDGRTQNVKYTADHYNGYVADVTYEGVPSYPEAKPYVPAPAPAYHA